MILENATRGTVLARRAERADTFWLRLRGLQFRRRFEPFDGLWLAPTNAIHMFWVFFPIDLVWLDADDQVVKVTRRILPWAIAYAKGARSVIELPAGAIEASGTEVGDLVAERDGPPQAEA